MKKLLTLTLVLTLLLSLNSFAPAMASAAGSDVISFTDPVLEELVRKQMGIPEGDITVAQAEEVIDLWMNRESESDPAITDISSLAPFINVSHLTLIGHKITDISVLENMWNLKLLDIGGNQVTDLSPLSKLPLESLAVWDNGITDISALAPIETLNNLMLNVNKISDFSPIQNLPNLQTLWVGSNATEDYSPLAAIYPQLTDKDFEVLTTPFDKAMVLPFNDPVLERKIREALGIPEGDVTAGDAALLRHLNADADQNTPDEERIHDIYVLQYFVNLEELYLNNQAFTDIAPLAELTKLRSLWMLGGSTYDLAPLANMTRMERMGINCGMQDADFIANMPGLIELRIDGLKNLPSALPQLQNLTVFCSLGGELTDISLLAQLPALTVVDLSWNLVSDVTPLQNLPLTELYLSGCPVEDFSPLKTLYPNLVGRSFEIYDLAEPENPDAVVTFADPVLEQKVREALGKPEGDITAWDAAQVTVLNIGNEWQERIPDNTMVHSLEGLEFFINLRELNAGFNAITDVTPLGGLTEMKRLNLGGNSVSVLSPLAGLTQMEDLTLFGRSIADISALSGMTQLRSLHLGNTSVGSIEALAGLTKFDWLYLDGCALEDISPLAEMTNLYGLDLRNNYVTDLAPLSGLQNLHVLKLENNPIADYAPIEAIYQNLQEKDFELGQTYDVVVPLKPEQPDAEVTVSDGALEAVLREVTQVYERPLTQKDLAGIGKLVVGDNAMWRDVEDISALAYCLNLEGLVIEGSRVSDLTPLVGLTKLRGIHIGNSKLSDVSPLAGLTTLTGVELQGNQITDISALQSLTGLERLDVTYNNITDFSPLLGLKNLRTLFIRYNATQDVSALKDMAGSIAEKDFDPNQPLEMREQGGGNPDAGNADNGGAQEQQGQAFRIPEDPDHVIVFADPVLELRIRKQLELPEGDITAKMASGVDSLYINNEYQDSFDEGSQFSDLSGLEYFINLKQLDISWNLVTNVDVLASLTSLEFLKMFGNQVSDIAPLANLLNLTSLNVGGNQITDISALEGLIGLQELLLDGNPIADYSPIEGIYPQLQQKDFELK